MKIWTILWRLIKTYCLVFKQSWNLIFVMFSHRFITMANNNNNNNNKNSSFDGLFIAPMTSQPAKVRGATQLGQGRSSVNSGVRGQVNTISRDDDNFPLPQIKPVTSRPAQHSHKLTSSTNGDTRSSYSIKAGQWWRHLFPLFFVLIIFITFIACFTVLFLFYKSGYSSLFSTFLPAVIQCVGSVFWEK